MQLTGQIAEVQKLSAELYAVPAETEPVAFLLVDENGKEIPAVMVDEETVFTATANDIRIGTTAATEDGFTEGTKVIPSYIVTEGYRFVTAGSPYTIPFFDGMYDFTKLQAIICPYNNGVNSSVAAEKVAINEMVYAVNSSEPLATVSRDTESNSINLGIANESGALSVLRYFTYKEVY